MIMGVKIKTAVTSQVGKGMGAATASSKEWVGASVRVGVRPGSGWGRAGTDARPPLCVVTVRHDTGYGGADTVRQTARQARLAAIRCLYWFSCISCFALVVFVV